MNMDIRTEEDNMYDWDDQSVPDDLPSEPEDGSDRYPHQTDADPAYTAPEDIDRIRRKAMLEGFVLAILAAACAFAGWRLAAGRPYASVLSGKGRKEKLELLEQMVDKYYLWDKDQDEMAEGLYLGLMYGLGDPYTTYYTAEEYLQENAYNAGTYQGIGIVMTKEKNGAVNVEMVYSDSPAEKAGLLSGDRILRIDGKDVAELSSEEVVSLIRSSGGDTPVELTVYRSAEDETLQLLMYTEEVEVPSVDFSMLEDDTGYIRITEFTGVTPVQYEDAFRELQQDGMRALVVDLRDNPGGLVSSVCEVLRMILPEGLIMYTEDKYGTRSEMTCDGKQELKLPLAVLVNGQSASAAEVFAGAVRDHRKGVLVGTRTYGKGIVQDIHVLSDGSAVKMTQAQYYTPDGSCIHGTGIAPDLVVIQDDSKDDVQLTAAINAVRSEKTEEQ